MDSTRPMRPTLGLGITRSVGSPASLIRLKDRPSGRWRMEMVRTPDAVFSQLTSGITAISSTNCVPLKDACKMTT